MPHNFAKIFPLKPTRAHEVCGAGSFTFAAIICGMCKGDVLWISEAHHPEAIHPSGLAPFCDPARVIYAQGRTQHDVLWMAEEALRSGAVSVVVTRVSRPLDLTAGRRLQLAAEAGKTLGLFLIPEGMGSNAAETRWRVTPIADGDSTLLEWNCIKNKTGTIGVWKVRWDVASHSVNLVSKAGERTGSPAPAL